MALAGQRARALCAIGKRHTALFLDIDWTLGLRGLGLGFVLLLLFLRLLVIVLVRLALLALLRTVVRRALHGALFGALLALHGVVTVDLVT
jgi:hypothetical protein